MNPINIFAYNVPEIIREIAKKGTESDITIYHRKDGETVLTILSPTRFPEKMSSLTDSIYPADVVILGIDDINRDLGEVLIALDLMKKDRGFIILKDENKLSTVRKIISNTVVSKYEFFRGSPVELASSIGSMKIMRGNEGTSVIIDHFFKVKSVGTVALGFVLKGTIAKHQNLYASSLDSQVQIRSIQMQDVDVDSAPAGSRVGLALKNIEIDDMERGMFLTENQLKRVAKIESQINFHPTLAGKNISGNEIFICDQMKYSRGFTSGNEITLDRPIAVYNDVLAICSNTSIPRILGTVKVQ
ncbi:selenocysteinyl-tRNA-specific translation factor [Thermoplasmatales archaeon]|nr:selenocysteinyl-tRNA-specific translation factor [Thermoplasmatales archaeon]